MTGGDHFYVIRSELLNVLADHVSEGHHDFGIVTLGGLVHASFISDEEIGCCDMGAEEITAEKNPVFFQIGYHGFGQ